FVGPGGGGGGGGNPAASFIEGGDPAVARLAPTRDFAGWRNEVMRRPAAQLLAALVSTHVDEVRRLIDTNKRVAVAWRRGGGPAILRNLVERPWDDALLLPAEVDGFPLRRLLDRLIKMLARFG